jgi:hypothetical protein
MRAAIIAQREIRKRRDDVMADLLAIKAEAIFIQYPGVERKPIRLNSVTHN